MSVIDSYRKELQYHIDMGVDKHFLGFVVKETLKGNFNEEDAIEMRGYQKGLKVALEMLDKVIAYEEAGLGGDDEEGDEEQ